MAWGSSWLESMSVSMITVLHDDDRGCWGALCATRGENREMAGGYGGSQDFVLGHPEDGENGLTVVTSESCQADSVCRRRISIPTMAGRKKLAH